MSFRNVLFLIADDWSPIAGYLGHPTIQTPNIDALAARGTSFDHAFCTSPSCAVSRANILTGQYSHTHGMYGHCHGIHGFRTHINQRSLLSVLQEKGVATGLIGKKHIEPASVYPFEHEYQCNHKHVVHIANQARLFFSEIGDRPFYLHVGYGDPHRTGKGFGNERTYRGVDETRYSPDDVVVPDHLPDVPEVREDLADYYQAISRFDTGIGAILTALEESGRADDTLVIVTSDHGMPFPGSKASSYDSGHHCPLIVARPGQENCGVRNSALVNWSNLCPTILEWMRVDASLELPERSFLPILEVADPEGWDEVFFSHNFHEVTNYYPYRVIRGRRFKYVRHLAHQLPMPLPSDLFRSPTWTAVREQGLKKMGTRPTEQVLQRPREALYDLESDPMETTNLVDNPIHSERLDAFRSKMLKFQQDTADPWLEQAFQEGEIDRGQWR